MIKKCKQCGKEFTPERNGNFCSRKCLNKYRYEHYKEEYVCDECGKVFFANKYNARRKKMNFCSNDCWKKHYWEEHRQPHTIVADVVCKICSTCGKLVPIKKFSKDKSKWDGLGNVCKNCYREYVRNVWSKTPKAKIGRKKSKADRRVIEAGLERIVKGIIKKICDKNIKKHGVLTCVYCGEPCEEFWHLEHKIPLSRGGTNAIDNLAISCPSCNLSKATKTYDEYMEIINET